MKKKLSLLFNVIALVSIGAYLFTDCLTTREVEQSIREVKLKTIPDSRIELFDVQLTKEKKRTVTGVTTSQKALALLKEKIGTKAVIDVSFVPAPEIAVTAPYGIINVPVATLYKHPRYTSVVLTQGIFGQLVRVLEKDSWIRVQLQDNYIGWLPREQIKTLTRDEFQKIDRDKICLTLNPTTPIYDKDENIIVRLSSGSFIPVGIALDAEWLEVTGKYEGKVRKRDVATLTSLANFWNEVKKNPPQFEKELTALALPYLKTSYLWAGTSSFGFDCSGFTQLIYRLMGLTLPRDSDQQARCGEKITGETSAGDLLFFGREDGTIQHAALALGKDLFIHARGEVRLGSFNESSPYFDAYEKKRFFYAVRPKNLNTISYKFEQE